MDADTFASEFEDLIADAAEALGISIKGDLSDISLYASDRTTHLSTLVGQPGFAAAVMAERDSVALRAGINVTRTSDLADQRIVGIIQGAMRIAAAAMAAV